MNRRELAKTGLLGFFGVLFGRVDKDPVDKLTLTTCGTDSNITHYTYHVAFPAGSTDIPADSRLGSPKDIPTKLDVYYWDDKGNLISKENVFNG